MAKAQINIPTKFLDALDAAAKSIDEAAREALVDGAKIVEPSMRTNLKTVITPGSGTCQLVASLGTSPVGVTSSGRVNVKVGFSENRADGVSHAKIATILEYGSSRQPARPFLAQTRTQTRAPVIKAMKTVFETRLKEVTR